MHRVLTRTRVEMVAKKAVFGSSKISVSAKLVLHKNHLCGLPPALELQGLELFGHASCDDVLLSEHKLLTLQELLNRRRLTYFLRLATVDCAMVRACAGVYFGQYSFWPDLLTALNRLKESSLCLLSFLCLLAAVTSSTIDVWSRYVIMHHATWASMVKRYRYKPIALGTDDSHGATADTPDTDSDDMPLTALL
eukprot:3069871-Amphidinium_carterae.1